MQAVDVPRLEQAVAASPDNTGLQVQLGMAQFKAQEYEAAHATLATAIEGGAESGAAYLYLGMSAEELEDWSGAREAYNTYLDLGSSVDGRDEVRKRLTMIGRNLLQAEARQALIQEAEITATAAVTPQSVAVMPMAFNSDNADLEPLVYALSDMMITDFQQSNALVVLERAQMQTLLDEMELESSGYAEPGTGARAGLLLRAEHVFQGVLTTLGGDEIQTDADVLNVPGAASAGQITESATLEQIFDLEKQLVIRTIREVLGVQLTPAEEQRILENRWTNVLAFLAYGRGLRALDNGDYGTAQAQFQQASELEPGSVTSLESATNEATALVDSEQSSTEDVAGVAESTGELGGGVVAPPDASVTQDGAALGINQPAPVGTGSTSTTGNTGSGLQASTLRGLDNTINPSAAGGVIDLGSAVQGSDQAASQTSTTRDPVQESTGSEAGTNQTQAQIRIVIRRPGSFE